MKDKLVQKLNEMFSDEDLTLSVMTYAGSEANFKKVWNFIHDESEDVSYEGVQLFAMALYYGMEWNK